MNDCKARLFIISAPSGCGKGTLIAQLNREFDIFNSVSCTTRSPREGEIDGVHYNFMTTEAFEKLVADDGFLEHAGFSGKYYGTPKQPVEENLARGRDVLLEIEPQGAFQVKAKRPDAVMIFILPPSVSELDRRLHKRAAQSGETQEQITARLATAEGDIKRAYDYDYVMMNDALEDALCDLKTIFTNAKTGGDLSKFSAANRKTMIDEVLQNA
jgi:guanylate kinase